MKIFLTLLSVLSFSFSFSQWTRVQQLPSSDISSLYHKGNNLYAGGKNIIYFSADKGQTWDSTSFIPELRSVDNMIVFKNELYASSFGKGVFKSSDGGLTWHNINAGIAPFVSDFSEWKDNLYAATEGNSIFKLNPADRNSWMPFSNGLSDFSINVTSIAGNSHTLIAGTLANGLYDYLAPGSELWEERFLNGQISPSEKTHDIITAHDSLFLAGSSGRFYLSTNDGFTWNRFGNSLPSLLTSIINARQAVLAVRNVFDGQSFASLFYYIKKDSLDKQFVPFSFIPEHFSYRAEILGDKLWDASANGLFYMSLSDLPGITAAQDTTVLISLPVRYLSFDARLTTDQTVLLQWQTADEFNIDHYEVERSLDRLRWNRVADVVPQPTNHYSWTDTSPMPGENYYRIKAVGTDGHIFYTTIRLVTIESKNRLHAWPNPVHDVININIASNTGSSAFIRLVDNKGTLIKMQKASLFPGPNQVSINIGFLANGIYSLQVEWDHGRVKKTVQVIKE